MALFYLICRDLIVYLSKMKAVSAIKITFLRYILSKQGGQLAFKCNYPWQPTSKLTPPTFHVSLERLREKNKYLGKLCLKAVL